MYSHSSLFTGVRFQDPCVKREYAKIGANPPPPRNNFFLVFFDDWLTVHRSITLYDLQLDAQNSYLFTHNTFIKILYMFRALPCSSSGGLTS